MSSTTGLLCAVITVSSSRAAGSGAVDSSGDLVETRLRTLPVADIERLLVADDVDSIRNALLQSSADLVVITGGTGIGAGDVTPEAVRPMLDRELPGMGEAMRAAGLAKTAHAMLSRQLGGVRGQTLVLALPGSTAACRDCLDAVWPALPHALSLLRRGAEP
ncbi:MAG: MogA/MoaB family molybdenum cofactor biosynthesis protein [Candidatus Dormibacteraeota bacterium]|uniref:Molybdenum cofactor biosynthesis protein n=1 Tax=Candidatus Aeolococcus gillhamiae TaxID=3127015 RepID=A0A2W5ZAV8_9BACT|nr:MogA/MoaB family molybdenum cofactor biosynthesis protein [Candidatus Dormibacteraeota bacterium]PZR82443.1 MAG: molybdenum cofactor biosynthesis protein [Candidatus Dormibacter sp. RRmetagenome_bin12]